MSKGRIRALKYGCTAMVVAAIAYAYVTTNNIFELPLLDKYRILADAFFVPGMLLLGVGGLMFVSAAGALDGIGYALHCIGCSLIPGRRLYKYQKYGDYIEHKQENRVKGYGFLLISGLVTIAVSVVFMLLFYSV